MKLKLIALISLFAFGFALSATAGTVTDTDGDLVPDAYDNCLILANGPSTGNGNQVDSDQDGIGNPCDADYTNDTPPVVGIPDFSIFLAAFQGVTPDPNTDHNGDGDTGIPDFSTFLAQFQGASPVGPSGLACAPDYVTPCLP